MLILNTKIGERLKSLRKDLGLSQEEVAKKSGISRPHYTSIEKGRHSAEDETLIKILIALDLKLSEAQNLVAKWRVEEALEMASDPSKVINSIVASNKTIVITGSNNTISK